MNWSEIFSANPGSLAEVVIRGTLTYLAIFMLLRVFRREPGAYSISDLILVVVVADAAQNAMAGSYTSVPDGVVLVATIVGWSYVFDFIAYRFPLVRKLIEPAAVPLIRGGVVLRTNLRANLLTMDELIGQLREHGVEEVRQVKDAFLESDGQISVIPFGDREGEGENKRRKPQGT